MKRTLALMLCSAPVVAWAFAATRTTPTPIAAKAPSLQTHYSQRRKPSPFVLYAFSSPSSSPSQSSSPSSPQHSDFQQALSHIAAATLLALSILASPHAVLAENELSTKFGSKLDTSLVDQTCLVNHCALPAKTCLKDDSDCRKGLTCTAKCLGNNACITGCMARYGNDHLDSLLKCTIEDHDCIQVAILPGGSDVFGQEPRAPAPTLPNFDPQSLQGSWYKVVGYNPNYDCYACQRNTFSPPINKYFHNPYVTMDVEFAMPHLLPDGASSPPPPTKIREILAFEHERHHDDDDGDNNNVLQGGVSIGLNEYRTRETMVFDTPTDNMANSRNRLQQVILGKGTPQEASYSRTAHSQGEMFGLKFWENWYIIGENDPGMDEFKFIYYNGKTRQNTYDGAFVYSRNKELSSDAMNKVLSIAKNAGMNPDQFCRIRNGCFADDTVVENTNRGWGSQENPFRGILASTKVSQLLGVEPVTAQDSVKRTQPTAKVLLPPTVSKPASSRPWWYELGDYLENPHRHFEIMNEMRTNVNWPKQE